MGANAYFDPMRGTVHFCYELMQERATSIRAQGPGVQNDKILDGVRRYTLSVLGHEIGHAVIGLMGVPVLGREEDVADGFALLLNLNDPAPDAIYNVWQVVLEFNASDSRRAVDRVLDRTKYMSDEHSLDAVRAANIACWLWGADSVKGRAMVNQVSERRRQRCPAEWRQIDRSWRALLGSALILPKAEASAVPLARIPEAVLARGQVLIPAGQFAAYAFSVQKPACTVDVKVQGLEGGALDVETYVFDEYNFLNWKSSIVANPTFNSGRNRVAQGTVQLGPGKYLLVVSNRFSTFTPKKVAVDAHMNCQ